MGQERNRSLTEAEERKHKADTPKEKIVIDRLWNKRPDGIAIKMPTKTKAGKLVILEFKRMSCLTDQYVRRARNVAETQYVSIKSALEQKLGPQGRIVSQRSFIAGARSLNEKNCMTIWPTSRSHLQESNMTRWTPPLADPQPPSSPLSKPGSLIIFGVKRRRRRRTWASINTLYYKHFVTHIEGGDHKVVSLKLSLSLSLSLTHTHTHTHTRTVDPTARINEIA
jgi:hypothetical protein